MEEDRNIPLPVDKLNYQTLSKEKKVQAVLVENGSFNPPTYMHLNMFGNDTDGNYSSSSNVFGVCIDSENELGKEALTSRGYHCLGGYMSPVNNAYGKEGLVSAEHRIKMCQHAVENSSFIMVDPWEETYQRTLKVLARVASFLHAIMKSGNGNKVQVFLLCGADLLESFTRPGVWIPDQMETICRDYGLVCVGRGGRDLRMLISENELLSRYKENIIIIDGIESEVSSTKLRDNLSKGLPIDLMTPPSVVEYIKLNNLYAQVPPVS